MLRASLLTVLLCLPLAVAAAPQEKGTLIDRKSADREPASDREFLVRAIACEVAEVKFAEKAEKSATDADVQKLAAMIAKDHKKVLDGFMEHAKKEKVAVVEGLEKSHREQYDRMTKLDGAAYDREYVRWVADHHDKAGKLYKKWAKDATDADLRALAEKAAANVEEHKDHVKKAKDKFKD